MHDDFPRLRRGLTGNVQEAASVVLDCQMIMDDRVDRLSDFQRCAFHSTCVERRAEGSSSSYFRALLAP